MQRISLFRTTETTPPPSRAILAAVALHASLLLALIDVVHYGPHIAPYKLPGTAQGVRLITYYSPGSPTHAVSDLTSQKPETQSPTSTSHSLQAPTAPHPAQPAAEPGSGSATQSGLGEGNITIALHTYFPSPKPDLSTLPHGFSGDVILDATVDETGKISNLTIVKGIGPSIDNAVIATVKQWSYNPATKDGVPVPSEQELHFHYEHS